MASKHFLQPALWCVGHLRPRVINVDGHPAYPFVMAELKRSGELSNRCQYRHSSCKNNRIEQDHRFIKKRIVASQWFRSIEGALHTIQGYEAMHMLRKGQIRWVKKGDIAAQIRFVNQVFGLAASCYPTCASLRPSDPICDSAEKIVDEMLPGNPKQVEQYTFGKTAVSGFLVGQVIKASHGQANPAAVSELLNARLG